MSELIGMLDAAKRSAELVSEYALDHYVHFGFLPNDVDVEGHVFDYETYNYLIDLFHPHAARPQSNTRMYAERRSTSASATRAARCASRAIRPCWPASSLPG